MALPSMPPSIPGVSEGDLPPNPLQLMARMMKSKPESAMMKLLRAVSLLREVATDDPRLEGKVQDALEILTQASEEHPGSESPGEPSRGPKGSDRSGILSPF